MNIQEYIHMISTNHSKLGTNEEKNLYQVRLLNNKVPLQMNNVKIDKSGIHGLGVFSIREIHKGDLVTLYPGDIVTLFKDGNIFCYINHRIIKQYGTKINLEEMINECRDYQTNGLNDWAMYGHPKFIDDPSYLGHMINDNKDIESINCKLVVLADMNCNIFISSIQATKDIKIGEELFVSYGNSYWEKRDGPK